MRRLFSSVSAPSRSLVYANYGGRDAMTNIPARLEREWFGRQLLEQKDHPLQRVRNRIGNFFGVQKFPELECVVSVHDNFDALLIPADHVSRKPSDTYYVNSNYVLRTHCTAHQRALFASGLSSYFVAGDVFRRDEVDASHFPVFHQFDAGKIFEKGVTAEQAEKDLKLRWRDDYFPFTSPSFELDVWYEERWLEVLGCGLIHPLIMQRMGMPDRVGWAFGMGIERLAMVLYRIPDIRTFWSTDERFMKQFRGLPLDADISFQEISRFPKTSRDISFWIREPEKFHQNYFFEAVREVAGDLVETVERIDHFTHPKTGRQSMAFRIDYRAMERTLESSEVNALQEQVRAVCSTKLNVELR